MPWRQVHLSLNCLLVYEILVDKGQCLRGGCLGQGGHSLHACNLTIYLCHVRASVNRVWLHESNQMP